MASIQDIDKNFKVDTEIERDGLVFRNALEEPFEIFGVKHIDGKFRRMPEEIAKEVNEGVHYLHANTSGGRIKFCTNSNYVAIKAVMPSIYRWVHFAMTGSSGFDIYVDNQYYRTYVPPFDCKNGYESVHDLDGEWHEILIHFPLYSEVSELYIGTNDCAEIKAPTPYRGKPIIYYGSSITQGGCAARPGMSYQNIISRRLGVDHINLGFSGNALGEESMARYIAGLDMSAFVYDYDCNAPNPAHLEATHERFFNIIREAQPSLPIILAPRPQFVQDRISKMRRDIILATYNSALAKGDKNVYFVSSEELTALCKNEGTVDNCHPTDLGFVSMAEAFIRALEKII